MSAPATPPRSFSAPPSDVIDPATRRPLLGSYEGPLPPVEYARLGRSLPFRIAHEKAWYYVAIVTPEAFVAVAMLRFGYAASTFAFVFESGSAGGAPGRFLVDRSVLAPPFMAKYSGEGGISFRMFGNVARFERAPGAGAFDLEVELGDLAIRARISGSLRPSPISAVAAVGDGLVSATEKRALLGVVGEARAGGRRLSLDQGLAGFDRSHGYLPRHTVWRWAYAMGKAESGEKVAFNIVDGFIGEAECAVWVDDQVYPVGLGKFSFDPERPLLPWRITSTCGALDLRFEPGEVHAENKDLVLVKSRFSQPVGHYSGTIKVGGRSLTVSRLLGVTEDQDATW